MATRKVGWMRRLFTLLMTVGLWWIPSLLWAGGGKPATKLVSVADTRNASGVAKWIGDVYNDNLWLFGALVVISMALMGLILGLLFDRLLVGLGLNLSKLDHHE